MSKKNWIYGRNVVLTGCSTGMGKEVCQLLIEKYGCNVMGVARNKAKLDELKAKYGDKFSYRRFNISSEQEWLDFAAEMETMGYQVDILINNAGMIQPFGQYNDMTSEQVQKVLNTNLLSILYGCKAMIPSIKKSNYGGIVNVASASAILPVGGESIYSATKGGVWAFTECLAQELRGFNISVSCVMPGPVKTDLYKAREGETGGNKASNFVQNIGITSAVAGKRIVKAIRKRKVRVIIDGVARLMDFGMRMCPSFTCKATSWFMKKFCNKVTDFKPIFAEQLDNAESLKARKAEAKNNIINKLEDVPANAPFKDDLGR